jgi:hypothetical protein
VATLPVAIYVTRFVGSYELPDAGWAIPLAVLLGLAGLALARRARTRGALRIEAAGAGHLLSAARILGTLGLCLAGTAVISLVVYAILEYLGSSG